MIEPKTFFRCVLIWLMAAFFVIDGGHLLTAQDSNPKQIDGQPADQSVEENELVPIGAPNWFDSNHVYSESNRTLFISTAPLPSRKLAQTTLRADCLTAIQKTASQWLADFQGPLEEIGAVDVELLVVKKHWTVRQHETDDDAAETDTIQYRGYAELNLNDEFKASIIAQQKKGLLHRRLSVWAMTTGTILTLLAAAFGYLKMDSATRGFYSRRLQTGWLLVAGVVISGLYWLIKSFEST